MAEQNLLKIESKQTLSKQIMRYTLLFIITAVCTYALFIVLPRTFLSNSDGNIDGIAQTYPIYSEIKRKIHALLTGQGWSSWSWDIGLGDDSFMEFNTKLFNPLTYLVIAFPQKYLDIGFTLMVAVEQYLSGLFFLLFGRKVNIDGNRGLIAAISYAFCGWVLCAISHQGTFLMATMLFPLLMLGTEKFIRKESPVLLMASVALHIIYSIQWAYVAGITIILYFIIRLLVEEREEKFFIKFLEFCGYGIVGIVISAIVLVGNFLKITGTTTESTVDNQLAYTLVQYFKIPTGFFSMDPTTEPYSVLGLPILIVLLLPVVITKIKERKTAAIMACGLFILSLIPVTGSLFNGMSYTVGRWYYVMMFFFVWAAMDCYSEEVVNDARFLKSMTLWIAGLAVWGIAVCYLGLGIIEKYEALGIALAAVLGFLLIAIFKKTDLSSKKAQYAIIATVVASIVLYFNICMFPYLGERVHTLCQVGRIESDFSQSTQRVGVDVQKEDDSFYRIDQVDGYTDARIARVRANENMYFGNRSIYTYLSTMNSNWHEFSRLVGNNAGYFDRTTVYSNDNREGLDLLMGVKYFLGDSETKKAGASEYAPYGYSYDKTIDGVDVLKNKYCIGLGTTYDKYITKSELMEYSPLEREQVMLQAAVVADDAEDSCVAVKHAKKSEIKTNVKEVQAEIAGIKQGSFTIDNEHHDFTISIPEVKNSRIVVAFEGLTRDKCDFDTEYKLKKKTFKKNALARAVQSLSYEDNEKFKIEISRGNIVKAAQMRKGKNQGYRDIEDYYINLGYFDNISGDINVNINRVGTYNYDSIKVYAVPMDIYEDNAGKLEARELKIECFDGDKITGTVDARTNSIMYLSILEQNGWDIYIDGNKVDRLKDGVNIAFIGTKIDAGSHELVMKYSSPGAVLGAIISAVGIAIMIAIELIRRSRSRSAR